MIPPGGWYYIQPETGFRVEADDFYTLITRVIAHREYKKITPNDPSSTTLDIDKQICDRLSSDSDYVIDA